MMRRVLLGLPIAVTACGLAERPYAERRQWPLLIRRPAAKPFLPGGRVLEVQELRAGPGLQARGLQTLQADGSMRTEFYEEWSVPPAQAIEDALRLWLGQSGRFAAVVPAASRVDGDLALEGEVTMLWTNAAAGTARAAIALTVVDMRTPGRRILLNRNVTATAPLAGAGPAAAVQAQAAALADVFAQIEAALPA